MTGVNTLQAQTPLEARDDYPVGRYFTINSDRYYLGARSSASKPFFGTAELNEVFILRGMIPYRGNLAADEVTFTQDNDVPDGFSFFVKHYLSQFMLGAEQLDADYTLSQIDSEHPEVDKISLAMRNFYLLYVIEWGELIISGTSFALGGVYGQAKFECNSAACRAAYPDYRSEVNDVFGGTFQIGIHLLRFFELNAGVTFFDKKKLELKNTDATKTFTFEVGKTVYYYGMSLRF